MGLLGRARAEEGRDITKILRASSRDPVIDVEKAVEVMVQDHYGKRKPRSEHEDVVMANEYTLMIKHVDDTIALLRERFEATVEAGESLKEVLQSRVVSLTRRVEHEKAVITAYRDEFKGLHTRVAGVIDAEIHDCNIGHDDAANGFDGSSGSPEGSVIEEGPYGDENLPAVQPRAPRPAR